MIQGPLGSQFLDDADQRVGDQDAAEQRVVQGTDDDDDHEQSAEQEVERREDVGPDDLADRAAAGDGHVVGSPSGAPLGDFSFGQTLTGARAAPPPSPRQGTGSAMRSGCLAFVADRASELCRSGDEELVVELSVGCQPVSPAGPAVDRSGR